MSTMITRTELSPYEEFLIAATLESGLGQEDLLRAIERLSQERLVLQARLAEHPWSEREAAKRLHAIGAELNQLWAEVRRLRAARRVQLEAGLGVDASFQEGQPDRLPQKGSEDLPFRKAS